MTFPRTRTPELMDDPQLPEDDHREALAGLARLNRISGVAGPLYSRLAQYAKQIGDRPLKVLDVASGSGDVPIRWALRGKRSGVPLQITTTDVSECAVEATRSRARRLGVEIGTLRRDCLCEGLPQGFDVVTCSLFMHHLDDAQAARLLQSMHAAADVAVLVCDLERSRLNLAMVVGASRMVSRSPIVHHDALASIRGAYTRREFSELAERALALPVKSRPLFPCRFLVAVEELAVPAALPAFA